jgi:hypothetical protein
MTRDEDAEWTSVLHHSVTLASCSGHLGRPHCAGYARSMQYGDVLERACRPSVVPRRRGVLGSIQVSEGHVAAWRIT